MLPFNLTTNSHRVPIVVITTLAIVLVLLYFWEIGHLNGIRQGSEALYLQVSQEMYQQKSYLTPLYRGEHHWSKPPLHFWLPFPIYWLSDKISLGGARVAVAIFTLFSVAGLAYLLRQLRSVPWYLSFTVLAATLGILKYARTYMMEIPLALLPALAMLLFWNIIENKPRAKSNFLLNPSFIGAVLLLALSVLIKGPVTIAMSCIALFIYQLYLYWSNREWIILPAGALLSLATLLASSWFIYCHLTYPQEFFQYFFLRENLGKFGQVAMPASKLIQGALLYTLPWIFVLPIASSLVIKRFKQRDHLVIYLLSLFIGFFFIWFIPAQKSHHYAIPSIPYLLILALIAFKEELSWHRWIKYLQIGFSALFLPLLILALYLAAGYQQGLVLALLLLLQLISLTLFFVTRIKWGIIAQAVVFTTFWSVILPFYFLPLVPNQAVAKLQNSSATIYLVDRRSYFFEQAISQEVSAIDLVEAKELLARSSQKSAVIIYHSKLEDLELNQYQTLHQWEKWVRRVKLDQVVKALQDRSLSPLKEPVYLLLSKSK
jgi:4-amino-4-deoxy-L-arabinose transferase-like glycosyltransferase